MNLLDQAAFDLAVLPRVCGLLQLDQVSAARSPTCADLGCEIGRLKLGMSHLSLGISHLIKGITRLSFGSEIRHMSMSRVNQLLVFQQCHVLCMACRISTRSLLPDCQSELRDMVLFREY